MDPAAFAALVEQCAPTPDLVRPLTAIVRQASSFEPLLITIEGRKPIPIQATNRDEAIQLATEAIAAGQQVRTGLAQLDAKETKQAGLTAATTFDACKHIAGLGKLFDARLQVGEHEELGPRPGDCPRCREFRGEGSQPNAGASHPADGLSPVTDSSTGVMPPTINTPSPSVSERPRWDVYRSGLGTSAFVYDR